MMHYDPYCLWGVIRKLGKKKFIMSLGYTYILNLENFQMQMGQRFPHLPSESSWRDTDQIVHARPYFIEVRHWQRRQHSLWASFSLFYYEHIPTTTSLVGSIFTRSYAHRYQHPHRHRHTHTQTLCYMHKITVEVRSTHKRPPLSHGLGSTAAGIRHRPWWASAWNRFCFSFGWELGGLRLRSEPLPRFPGSL